MPGRQIDSLSAREQVWLREFIGETCSCIYAPFYYKNKTYYDAVLDRPVHRIPVDEKAPNLKGKRDPGQQISFIPAICPQLRLGPERGKGNERFYLSKL